MLQKQKHVFALAHYSFLLRSPFMSLWLILISDQWQEKRDYEALHPSTATVTVQCQFICNPIHARAHSHTQVRC